MGGSPIAGAWADHFNEIDNTGSKITETGSQNDFAVIDFASDLSSYGSFGTYVDYAGGQVHLTGYPSSAHGVQTDQTGTVQANAIYDTLDYVSVAPSPGNSGGPLWLDLGTALAPQPYVVGIVSTSGWAVQLTGADMSTISSWEAADSYLWTGSGAQLLHARQGAASVVGGAGDDTITGWSGDDTLFGSGGDDSIVGGTAFNQVNGNAGDDVIVGNSQVGDWLLGGQGNDQIDARASTGNNVINGNLGDDTLFGGSGADSLRGGQGDDVIHAGSGADWISGDLGDNIILGGAGVNIFRAGAGHDQISGWHAGDEVQIASGVGFSVTQVSTDVHINFSNGGEMDLLNVQVSSLQPNWIVTA
jgi:Ca2+-binding RTX toxin-like protein